MYDKVEYSQKAIIKLKVHTIEQNMHNLEKIIRYVTHLFLNSLKLNLPWEMRYD